MDIGVGSFVFTSGVVSAIPLIKNPSHLTAPMIPKVITVIRKCLPIILLGVIRVLLVKGTEYPEHETEYGTHWNFFITLALLPVLQVFLHPLIARVSLTGLGVAVALAQQFIFLSPNGLDLQSYILHTPRDRNNLVSANKEGIISLTGYFAIHLLGLATGTLVLPPSPSYFRRAQRSLGHRLSRQGQPGKGQKVAKKRDNSDSESDSESGNSDNEAETIQMKLSAPRQDDKTATELCAYAVAWWVLTGVAGYLSTRGTIDDVERQSWGVSRRLVNLPYIFWICAYNVSFILGYLLLDMIFYPSQGKQKKVKASPPPSPSTSAGFRPLSPSASANLRPPSPVPTRRPNSPTPRPLSPLPPASPTWPSHSAGAGSIPGSYNTGEIPPPLLEAINKNGLVLFLVANLLTGVINLSIPTMYASDTFAMVILGGYTWVICALAWWTRRRRILRL
ncbi:Glucosaminyl phosphatidylinositol (GlcN-PI) nositol acylation protein, variant 2 [Stygiomarasmius scandens]